MRERNIQREEVLQTLRHPDNRYRQSSGRVIAFRRIFKGTKTYGMVAVSEETTVHTRIITVFITSKIKKYLQL